MFVHANIQQWHIMQIATTPRSQQSKYQEEESDITIKISIKFSITFLKECSILSGSMIYCFYLDMQSGRKKITKQNKIDRSSSLLDLL